MDQSVRNLLNKKMKLGGQELNVSDVLLLAAITVLAVWVRTAVRSFVAQDWTDYWSLWLEELRAGGFKALAGNFYDYAPPVMYLLYLITLLPINSMTAFKAFCCMLDFVGRSDRKYGDRLYRKQEAGDAGIWCILVSSDGDPQCSSLVSV